LFLKTTKTKIVPKKSPDGFSVKLNCKIVVCISREEQNLLKKAILANRVFIFTRNELIWQALFCGFKKVRMPKWDYEARIFFGCGFFNPQPKDSAFSSPPLPSAFLSCPCVIQDSFNQFVIPKNKKGARKIPAPFD
jgi:hypothetical protein